MKRLYCFEVGSVEKNESVNCFVPFILTINCSSSSTDPVAMAKDPLAEAGFYFDELNKLRVLEPDVSQKTSELKEECKEFVDSEYWILCLFSRACFPLQYQQVKKMLLCVFIFLYFLQKLASFRRLWVVWLSWWMNLQKKQRPKRWR